MKFSKTITIDWYDNVLKAFCIADDHTIYYCCLLAMDKTTNEKIYLCAEIKYLKGKDKLIQIIENDSFKERWDELSKLTSLKPKNKTYLVKAKDLLTEDVELLDHKQNHRVPKSITWGDYPYVLDKAQNIDNWWSYYL
jgi:hypothetical protein